MKHYPIFLNLEGRTVLIVGGGKVALQKVRGLLETGALIRVVSPEAVPPMRRLAAQNKIMWQKRPYKTDDLDGTALLIAATDDSELQKRIVRDARSRQIWVNVVDVPFWCDFIAPAVIHREPIQLAISTGGASPALAKRIRQQLESVIGSEHGQLARVLARYRGDILKLKPSRRKALWAKMVSERLLRQIKSRGPQAAERRLKELLYGNTAV